MGCVLLASKVEEVPQVLREVFSTTSSSLSLSLSLQVLIVFHDIFCSRNLKVDVIFELGGERYTAWKNGKPPPSPPC
jgi:hypothetical protein